MASFNRVILLGNLTRDPELRHIPSGNAVCELGLAVNRSWTSKQTGQREEETTFVDVTLWGRDAENAEKYLKKGQPVLIEGRLKLDTWQDKTSGQNRSKLGVVCERMQFLPKGTTGGGGGSSSPPPQGDAYSAPASDPANTFYDADPPDAEVPF